MHGERFSVTRQAVALVAVTFGLGLGQGQAQTPANAPAQGSGNSVTATRTLSRMRYTTQAQRAAAAERARAALAATTAGARKSGMARTAASATAAPLIVCNAPTGAANADYMGLCPNWSNSPVLRKFVDSLPGLGPGNANNLGQYIPIAQPKANPLYPSDDYYEIGLVEYRQRMHSDLPAIGTKLRGYVDLNSATPTPRYLGPLIVARRDKAVRIKFSNQLPLGAAGKLFLPVDTTYMGTGLGPDGIHSYTDNRAVLHLHGGNTPWISDGTPHQWVTPAGEVSTTYLKGMSFQNVPDMVGPGLTIPSPNTNDGLATYYYTNQQSGRLMFYHDHSYGTTRLNVYGGEAAGYLLTDAVEDGLINSGVIPGAPLNLATNAYAYGIPLVIQDKGFVSGAPGAPATGTFFTDPTWPSVVPAGAQAGDLWFPHVYMPNQNPGDLSGANAMGRWDYGPWFWPPYTGLLYGAVPCPTAENPAQTCPGTPNPSGVPEAFMDTPIINGAAYPFATLEAKPYRFRILNATNDRHLNLQLYVAEPLTVAITNGGSDYTLPPTVAFTTQPGDTGSGAAGTAVLSTGSVTDVAVLTGGANYAAPTVAFSGGGGTGAAATAAVTNGIITGIVMTAGGSGYVTAPTVTITDAGPGTGATAASLITPAGAVIGVTVTNPGSGYTLPPLVSFTNAAGDTTGVGATAIASVNTEVKMADALPHPGVNPPPGALPPCPAPEPAPGALYLAGKRTGLPQFCWPAAWPKDGRDGGVPDPTTAGPAMIQIGTEGGLLPAPVVIPSQPVGYNYNRRDIVVLNVQEKALFLGPAERADIIVDFSGYAGKTLILYNDSPAPVPASDPRFDYYTGDPDLSDTGGAPTTLPGFGPNTRTIMQIRVVAPTGTPAAFSLAALQTALPQAFAASFPLTGEHPMVPESAYNPVYNPATPYADTYARIQDNKMTFTPIGQTTAPAPIDLQPKAIQELFTTDYGRMNATLGVELPNSNATIQTTIPLAYIDPPTEVMNDGQTQVWKITHNGVDTHAVHFHLFNVQVINRVGWDGAIRPPDPNELGFKETVRMNPLEDAIVAIRPMKQVLPFGVIESQRPLDVTKPIGSTGQFTNIDPLTNNPITVFNQMTNFGWEYVWHCHLLGHEENDMMRPIVFKVQPIAVPQSVTATATATPLQVTVGWTYTQNPANPATAFRIVRSTGATTANIATITNVALTSFVDATVAFGTTYSYRVIAFNASGASLPSITATVTTPAAPTTPLPAPTNLTAPSALVAPTAVTLMWTAVSGATGYTIQRSTNSGATWQVVGTSATQVFRVIGLTTKTTYMFRVIAQNGNPAATSAPSTPITVTTK